MNVMGKVVRRLKVAIPITLRLSRNDCRKYLGYMRTKFSSVVFSKSRCPVRRGIRGAGRLIGVTRSGKVSVRTRIKSVNKRRSKIVKENRYTSPRRYGEMTSLKVSFLTTNVNGVRNGCPTG